MAGTIWFIVEGQFEDEIIRAILKNRYPQVHTRFLRPTGATPNLSRLAKQIENLIQTALKARQHGDCIAVLHDADLQTRPHAREDYEQIKKICQQYTQHVKYIVASDEIEAWLLADNGLCNWLGRKAANVDNMRKPSEVLAKALDKAGKPKYRKDNLRKIVTQMDASGDTYSPSLREALKHLENAPCVQS